VSRLRVAIFLAAATAVLAAAAGAATPRGELSYEDNVRARGSIAVAVTVRRPAAFRVLLRAPTAGRTRLFLLGRTAPRVGPLFDTRTTACEGAAGSFFCRGSFEALPAGTYTFRIVHRGRRAAHVELTVRW
jgi:hypothetical protein